MTKERIIFRSEKLLEEFLEAIQRPLPLNIVDVRYDGERDRFLTVFDIGIFTFETYLNVEKLEQLVTSLKKLKQ